MKDLVDALHGSCVQKVKVLLVILVERVLGVAGEGGLVDHCLCLNGQVIGESHDGGQCDSYNGVDEDLKVDVNIQNAHEEELFQERISRRCSPQWTHGRVGVTRGAISLTG